MINILVSGPFGRMGQAICRLAAENPAINLLGGLVSPYHKSTRTHNLPKSDPFSLHSHLSELPPPHNRPFVLIDFTTPDATIAHLQEAADLHVPVVIGTTGFSSEQLDQINHLSKSIPILLSANMSVGINLLLDMVQGLAERLPDYDIEIIETHHRLKKDAPSGTALALAKSAAAGRQVNLDEVSVHGRSGFTGERPQSEIGIHAVRGGDVVGDHTVLFAGLGERIELTHKATSRDTFASGALFAASFLSHQSQGLYSMKHALSTSPL